MNNTVTITVGPVSDDLEISTFFNQYFLSTPAFQEPAQPTIMDEDNHFTDDFLKHLENLMERTKTGQP